MTRLLYNVATWSAWTIDGYRILNSVYLRVLRRIAGECRYGHEHPATDINVKKRLSMPSLWCLIMRRRLLLFAAVVAPEGSALESLLSLRIPAATSGRLPWVSLITKDLAAMHDFYAGKLAELGDPESAEGARKWCEFIKTCPIEWRALVRALHFVSTDYDVADSTGLKAKADGGTDTCHECGCLGVSRSFVSEKVLAAHCR